MGFLDNIENSLKHLESSQEHDPSELHQKRQQNRAEAMAVAPWAEKLRNSAYTQYSSLKDHNAEGGITGSSCRQGVAWADGIAAHFALDAARLAATSARCDPFLQNLGEDGFMKGVSVPRGE